MSIRNSMYRIVFILSVLPFVFFSLITTHIYTSRFEEIIVDSMQVVADAQTEEMVIFCEQQNTFLNLLGTMEISYEALNDELSKDVVNLLDNMLFSRVNAMDYIKSLTILDTDYRVVACSEPHDKYAHANITNITSMMEDKDFYISGVLYDAEGEKTLVATSKIMQNNKLVGYVLEEITLDFYDNVRQQTKLWNDATFYLLDSNMNIVSAGTSEEDRQDFITTPEDRTDYNKKFSAIDFEANPKGSFRYEVRGAQYITYYSDVEYTDWRILLSVNVDQYWTQKNIYYMLGIFFVLLCAVVAAWVGWFVSRRIVRPIKGISNILVSIQEKQDYTLRVPMAQKDEIGELTEEINKLITFIETEDLYKLQQQRILQEKAQQDALTKVYNKEMITEYLEEALKRHRELKSAMAVLFLDVDDFKAFNTEYGHSVGDQVLLFITTLLKNEIKGTVGRIGGDEFLVVVEDKCCVEELDSYLHLIEEQAESRFVVKETGTSLPIHFCIGAVKVDFGKNQQEVLLQDLIQQSDSAMYEVKNDGKNGHVIYELF